MEERIAKALTKLFDKNRIVFWYDAKRELRDEYEALTLPDAEKIELKNNDFGVKYRILREEPTRKFLLYHEGPQPADIDNWLLDVQLAQGSFQADQLVIWMSELGLSREFADALGKHSAFFSNKKRLVALKRLLEATDTLQDIQLKMLGICTGAEPSVEGITEALLAELAAEQDDKSQLIRRCQLDDFLWTLLAHRYGYESAESSVHDFVIELFKSCYAMGTQQARSLTDEALVFLRRWKDSIRHREAFETLSEMCAHDLDIEKDLHTRDYHDVIGIDYFRLIDQKVLSSLVREVVARKITLKECLEVVHERRSSHWYGEFADLYSAVEYGARLLYGLEKADLRINSMADGVRKYAKSWFRFDQLYRKFVFHYRRAGQLSLVEELAEQVENLYTNNYVLKVNDNWQHVVDETASWEADGIPSQRQFYARWVKPFLKRDKKVFIIISDAMRFEIGDSLLSRIRQEDRYDAVLSPMLASLPSITKIGMAALLPHDELAVVDEEAEAVLVDGLSSQGTTNRAKILDRALPGRATAIQAEDLLGMDRDQARELTRKHQVVYVYHNEIDATGDKRDSEQRVFEAVDKTLDTLLAIIKKLTGANANNLVVTADHGFLYQARTIDKSDFVDTAKDSGDSTYHGRRFVLGTNLPTDPALKTFQASDVGLGGNMQIQIPKSINRLRLKGAGSRFVHGGAALQEVVVPVLQINKKRQSDLSRVSVEILAGETSVITSGQLSVKFYQTVPASDKVRPSVLRAGIYTQDGHLISDRHNLVFDSASDSAREREKQVQFILTRDADKANDQQVVLRLEEKVEGTTHYRVYKTATYQLRRSFTTDFDF
jgi:uncharacterized protein (TIGR02687 family)